ncbi:MAG: porin [Reichenbachiella sp.]|uniref:porin n=1 Tax=Reichenbachiella sp. TaxID=2184521 RepID=UPI0032636219
MKIGVTVLMVGLFLLLGQASLAQLAEKIRINGYSSFEYEYMISDEGKGDPNGSFDADLIDIVINVDITSNLRFATDLTWEHGSASEDGLGNVAVEYAFPEYTVRNWLKFRAGKMFVPFGIYNEIHTAKPAFLAVKEPLSTNKPQKFGAADRFYPRWATGISVLGNFSIKSFDFEYHVQLSNGEQENTNRFEEDDNKEKAVAMRLLMMPLQDLKIGVSTFSDRVSELDALDEDTGGRTKVFSISSHAEYTKNNFGLELEYITGKTKHSTNGTLKKSAFEGMVYYTLMDKITPYFRYEYLDPNKDVSSDEANMFSFGVNTRIDKNFFLKLQYNRTSSSADNSRFSGVDFSEFQSAIVLGF